MSVEEAIKIHEEALKRADDLYAEHKINSLELAAIKSEADHEYRKNLSIAH